MPTPIKQAVRCMSARRPEISDLRSPRSSAISILTWAMSSFVARCSGSGTGRAAARAFFSAFHAQLKIRTGQR